MLHILDPAADDEACGLLQMGMQVGAHTCRVSLPCAVRLHVPVIAASSSGMLGCLPAALASCYVLQQRPEDCVPTSASLLTCARGCRRPAWTHWTVRASNAPAARLRRRRRPPRRTRCCT